MKSTKLPSLFLAVILCMAALFCSLTCSAMASEADAPASTEQAADTEETKAGEKTESEEKDGTKDTSEDSTGKPLSEETEIYTRDLLYDEDTHKQFITVSTKEGDTFYIVIDYDKPSDEDGEQYEAYFLNAVDNADLTALLGEEEEEPPVCTCTTRCAAGAVDMTCEVCAANMTECAGEEPEPEPEETGEEPESNSGYGAAAIALILLLAMAGGGTAYYVKMKKSQTTSSGSTDLDNYDFGDDDVDGEEYEAIPEETEEPDEDHPVEDTDKA